MATYASTTSVATEKSRMEIERILIRFGATDFMYAWKDGAAVIEFIALERRIRFLMKLPRKDDNKFTHRKAYNKERENSPNQVEKLWEQECRSSWRALALLVKAKLAAVEAGITSFEEEFLSHIVVPIGSGKTTTTGEWVIPQLAAAYKNGSLKLLPSGG